MHSMAAVVRRIFLQTPVPLVLIPLLVLAMALPLSACRYTIREIGFSTLASPAYRLTVHYSKALTQQEADRFAKLCEKIMAESNLAVALDQRPTPHQDEPIAVLTFDSLKTPFVFRSGGRTLSAFIPAVLQDVLSSSTQKQILHHIVTAHAVLLFIAGTDPEQTQRSRLAIQRALEQIDPILSLMPKPSAGPPVLLELPISRRGQERVLLWSLGALEQEIEPTTVVLYGRGRQMGPALQGNKITAEAIYYLLSLVGADCECDLDHSWLLGSMIPLSWTTKTQALVAQSLGFDPENPLVKMELHRIARMRPRESAGTQPSILPWDQSARMAQVGRTDISATKTTVRQRTASQVLICFLILSAVSIPAGALIFLLKKKRRSPP
ncbi:hypothetical protein GX408_12550 [bacterium]|nr:hypothetical protein [bacterium]